jgi:hypothetical protein
MQRQATFQCNYLVVREFITQLQVRKQYANYWYILADTCLPVVQLLSLNFYSIGSLLRSVKQTLQ